MKLQRLWLCADCGRVGPVVSAEMLRSDEVDAIVWHLHAHDTNNQPATCRSTPFVLRQAYGCLYRRVLWQPEPGVLDRSETWQTMWNEAVSVVTPAVHVPFPLPSYHLPEPVHTPSRRCVYQQGTYRCGAWPSRTSSFCASHDPASRRAPANRVVPWGDQRCAAITVTGERCLHAAERWRGSEWCSQHRSAAVRERVAARRLGDTTPRVVCTRCVFTVGDWQCTGKTREQYCPAHRSAADRRRLMARRVTIQKRRRANEACVRAVERAIAEAVSSQHLTDELCWQRHEHDEYVWHPPQPLHDTCTAWSDTLGWRSDVDDWLLDQERPRSVYA